MFVNFILYFQFILFLLSFWGVALHAEQKVSFPQQDTQIRQTLVSEKDLKEFKVYIQNLSKPSLSLAEAEEKETERETKKAKRERRDRMAPQLIRQIEAMVQTPEHADNFAFWVSFLGKNQYVLALEAFAEQYNHSILHQQILNIIFEKSREYDSEFFEWNYRDKHLQNFWGLLLKKLPAEHPLIPKMEELISGKGWKKALIGYPGPAGLPEILSCDDWAEWFKQGEAPYELQAAPIFKCLDIYQNILGADYQGMSSPEFECMVWSYENLLLQLKSVQALKETKNKKKWGQLVLLFQELRSKIKKPPLRKQKIQSIHDYFATHPKEKAILSPLKKELARSIDIPSDLLKGTLLLSEP